MQLSEIMKALQHLAPLELAEDWDNVGLLAGDPECDIQRVMTCLSIDQTTCQEAINRKANLILVHHPAPFRPLNRIVTDDPLGWALWRLIGAGVAIYSPHTAWDNAPRGINQQLAEMLSLKNIRPLLPQKEFPERGSGRQGELSTPVPAPHLQGLLQASLQGLRCRWNHLATLRPIKRLAIVCGSGGSFVPQVAQAGCDALLTGEVTYHQAQEATHRGISLFWIGHYPSERFAMERLATMLASSCPSLEVWASEQERDPIVEGREEVERRPQA